ncbi:DUF523 domain-containing protein [Desulfosediminicola ganghwensis]|uniref:DUF523 domain-containing protein n=1 Tax=Desulfosediminicola ganghwensis TaxID=2569540 RepID=UPI0010AD3B06|nr:DUF523 domain-containing protein [Desulfosediminicola ganghwensis]
MSGKTIAGEKVRILISACLTGEKVRYDGSDVEVDQALLEKISDQSVMIPCCPEMAGGLPVPRSPAEIRTDGEETGGKAVLAGIARVKTAQDVDVTEEFSKGAELALQVCEENGVQVAILTERSPSCGVTMIYDGTFSGAKISGVGVTTALLKENGVQVFSQNQLEDVLKHLTGL